MFGIFLVGIVLGSMLTYLFYIRRWEQIDEKYRQRSDEHWARWQRIADELEKRK